MLLPLSELPDDLVLSICVWSPDVIMMSPSEFISGPVFVSPVSITCDQFTVSSPVAPQPTCFSPCCLSGVSSVTRTR